MKTCFGRFGALQSGFKKVGPRVINHPSLSGTSLVLVMKFMCPRKPLFMMQKSPVSYNGYRRLEDNCNTSAAAQKIGLKATLCFFFLILFVTCFLLAFIYLFIFGCVGSSLLRGVFP